MFRTSCPLNRNVNNEAMHHVNCYSRFLLKKEKISSTGAILGRPQDKGMLHWFQMLCQWLESKADAELHTLKELHDKMLEFSGGSADVYTIKRLKQKVQEHYEDFVFFAEVEGRGTVLCFKNTASYIINDKWYSERKQDIEEEARRIVIALLLLLKL